MIDSIKKTLLAGFGAAVITKETVDTALREWIEKGKISPEEAKNFAERLVSTGENRWEKTKEDVSQKISDVLKTAPFARRSDLEALSVRVALLEQFALRASAAGEPKTAPEADAQ